MERKVSTAFLKIGMYVSNLDRPWRDSPFLLEGLSIKDMEDIQSLDDLCDYVFIDTSRGVGADMYLDVVEKLPSNEQLENILSFGGMSYEYSEEKSVLQEMPFAKMALDKAKSLVNELMEQGARGERIDMHSVRLTVEPILDSMVRNTDAFMWLTKMQQHDAYTYNHAIDNCTLGIAFGRHLGLEREELCNLAMGLLLMDVGKTRLPQDLLNRKGKLTHDDEKLMQKHVYYSVDILSKIEGIHPSVINTALTHHERFDGSGYPNGLVGTRTPVYGRIAAIIDTYDAMTRSTTFREAVSEHEALQEIYNMRDSAFQPELVEQFMQCMGVYPTGSLVEMSTGEVGVIMSQNQMARMKPRVMMLLDEQKQHYQQRKIIDLSRVESGINGAAMNIAKSLGLGAYGIDTRSLGM